MTPWWPSVSVVVAARNAADTVGACVQSLLELHYPADRLDIRVVDNGSRDATLARLRGYGDRMNVLHEARRGPAAARNAGIRCAATDVVAFTDADCVVDRDWLARLVAPLRDLDTGIVGGTILALPPAGEIEQFGESIHDHRQAIEEFRPPYAITMSWASPRWLLERLGGFDPRLRRGEDVDLSYRIAQAGFRLRFVADAIVYHRNERTLPALFAEGFAHGLHGVRVRKHHEPFLAALGHPRVNRAAYRDIRTGVGRWARGDDDMPARCATVFGAGKKAGKLLGSVRFAHLDL